MKTLLEIEQAIAKLPKKAQRQLIRDLPDLCAAVFPADGWNAILADRSPRPELSKLLDSLDAEYRNNPEKFLVLNEDSLAEPKYDKRWAAEAESRIDAVDSGRMKTVPSATLLAYRAKSS